MNWNPFRLTGQRVAALLLLLLLAACDGGSEEQLPAVNLDLRRLDLVQARMSQLPDTHVCRRFYVDSLSDERRFIAAWMLGTSVRYFDTIPDATLDTSLAYELCKWAGDPNTRRLFDSMRVVWPEQRELAERLRPAFQRMSLHLPGFKTPRVRTLAWGYDPRRPWETQFLADRFFIDVEHVGIGLDYFCGPDFPYLHPQMPQFVRERCRPENLEAALVDAMLRRRQPPLTDAQMPSLLDRMIHAGIRLYATQRILPDAPDSLLLGYGGAQLKTAQEREADLYALLVPLLFDQNPRNYDWATREAPFTQRLGKDYPPRIGEYVGLQIVRRYAAKYESLKLEDLLRMTDYRKLFELSGYKPK